MHRSLGDPTIRPHRAAKRLTPHVHIRDCKIACNIDPLRGDFRVQFRPPLTLCVSVLPLASIGREGLMGMIGVDRIGEIRRAYFEQQRSIKEIVRTLSVSRATVRKVIRGHRTEFKYEREVQPTPRLGDWVKLDLCPVCRVGF
jgi:hypothetical protein